MDFKKAIKEIFKKAVDKFNIQSAPSLHLHQDEENAKKIFGRTAYYSPEDKSIVLYITNRHPKDVLRSFCHELIHHVQNERGDLMLGDASSPNYAQEDDHMREMEKEAYLEGNLLLRDFEDNYKKQMKEYTGTGAGGGNSTDGNDVTSPRPFADDEDEIENYTNKNIYGSEGGHYRRNKDFNYNRPAAQSSGGPRFENKMKKSDISKLVKESIQEVLQERRKKYGVHDKYDIGHTQTRNISGYPGVWEENINEEDVLVTRGKLILQILNEPGNEGKKSTFNSFIKKRTNGKFSLPNKIDNETDGQILALMSLRAKDFGDVFSKAKDF